jgi:hypothetical protein
MAGFLQASGNPISMSQINSVFDGRGNNLNAYRGTTWFTAAGGSGTFSSGTISFSDFYDKGPSAAVTISLASLTAIYGDTPYPGLAFAYYLFNSNGVITYWANGVNNAAVGNWATPTTAGIGSSYWIRFTQTASSGTSTETGSARGVWISLSITPTFGIEVSGPGFSNRYYTVQIASDSGGSNIVATQTNVEIGAESVL